MRAGPEDDRPVVDGPADPMDAVPMDGDPTDGDPTDGDPRPDASARPPQRMPSPPPPRPARPGRSRPDAATALPPPPYRAAPPPSAPFGDAGALSSLPPVPPPAHRPAPAAAVPVPVPAARNRWVPAADDTQVMTSLPPVPRGSADEPEEDFEAREGAPGASGGILRAAGTMAVATLVSRITGLLRTMVLAAALGVALVGDAYNTTNTLPNIVYELLLGGVLSSVIVPLFVHAQERDRDGGVGYVQRLSTVAITGLAAATVLAVLAAPLLNRLTGITEPPEQVALADWLARLLLIEIVFYGVGALAQAILNSRDVFGPPAWAPALNNVVVITTGLLFIASSGPGELTPLTITPGQVWLLGIGTTLGIALQALVLLPLLPRHGVPLRPRWGLKNTGLREAGTLGLWVVAYSTVSAIGVVIATRVANHASHEGGLGPSAFGYASLLFQMPYGIIGVALLTALLPRMSRAAARQDVAGVVKDLVLGTRLSALGLLPVTAALIVLGPPLCVLAFAHGQTSTAEARSIGVALAIGAFGLLPMAVTLLQLRVFYAMKDARTPTLIQVGMVAIRVPLLFAVPALVEPRHVVAGLMLVTSITFVAGWIIGNVALQRRLGALRTGETLRSIVPIAVAAAIAGVVGGLVVAVTDDLLGASTAGSLGLVVIGTVVIGGVALAGLVVARVPEVREPLAAVRARVGRG